MTFIIAEVGSNWETLEDCLDSITQAKLCGASAAKFQLFTHEELYGLPGKMRSLPKHWLKDLAEHARKVGLEFMCTPFSPEGLDYVDPYVQRHKVASSEISHPSLLERARRTNKPLLLSTGGASLTDIACALNVLGQAYLDKTTLLHCNASYPASGVDLFGLDQLREFFPCKVGYSCHTVDLTTPVSAVIHHGAVVVEKHFKIRDMPTPDNPHSIGPKEFKQMVEIIHERDPVKHVVRPTKAEFDMALRHKRRLIAILPIPKGEALQYGVNFGAYRSLKDDERGVSGFARDRVNGRTAAKDISPGDPLGPGDWL